MSLEIYGLDLRLAKKMLFTGVNLRIDKPNLVVYVLDESGDPIEGADVNILSAGHDLDSVTDALGTALTRFMPAINNTLTVSKDGYATSTQIIYNETPSTLSVYVQLYASEIRLKVVNNQNEPIEGATCRVLNAISESNNVLSFDGVDDYLQSSVATSPIYPFTMEALVKINTGSNHTFISMGVAGNNNIYFTIGIEAGKFFIIARNSSMGYVLSNTGLITGDYQRVSGVFESATTRSLYLDGNLLSGTTVANSVNININNFLIGRLDPGGTYPLNGICSDVRIWNKALSQSEIQENLFNRLLGSESNLIHYLKLDEGSGASSSDLVGNINPTIYGATWAEVDESFPLYWDGVLRFEDTPYDTGTTNANGLTTLNYQINTIHGLEVTLPGKRRFIMPFQRTTRGLLDWQVMLSDYLATFVTDQGNILINSEPENNDATFLIE